MKKILVLPVVAALSIFCSCQKQQTDAERQAEVDRQVQQKLDAEHQAQEREDLARREGELNAREKALAPNTPAEERSTRTQDRQSEPDRHTQDRQVRGSQTPSGDYGLFYSKLEPHGDWMETSDYGYVFRPREAERSTWRPYTNGRWVYTDAGCTWVSEESFGWATYHYGRWTRIRNIGWVWIPGDEWAPAWVSWRKSDSYVGWAPLPPEARFDHGTGIHNWADNYYDIGPENYSFVQTREFGSSRVERAVVPVQQNLTIVNQTSNVTNITYNNTTIINQGPNYDEIRTRTAEPMQRLKLERDVNVNINIGDPRSALRADVVVIPAPLIPRAQAVERRPVVKKTVTNIVVERGWDGLQDRQAAEQARAKIRSEATPPPNAPSKTFLKPTQTRAEATPVETRSTSTASAAPNESASPQTSATAFRLSTPTATATPQPTFTPRPPPRSTSTPVAAPSASASSSPRVEPSTTATSIRTPEQTPRAVRPMNTPSDIEASPLATVTPQASVAPSATAAPVEQDRRGLGRRGREMPPPGLPSTSPTVSARSTSTAPVASPSATEAFPARPHETKRELRREEKQERKRDRREAAEGLTSPSPSSTPTPSASP
jgi:hypothetical protein